MMSLREAVAHPLTAITAVLSALTQVVHVPVLDAVFAVVWTQIGAAFTGVSIFAFTIIPNVGSLGPLAGIGAWTQYLAIALGAGYGLKILAQLYDRIQTRLNQ